jgi:hypothetical protein
MVLDDDSVVAFQPLCYHNVRQQDYDFIVREAMFT